MSVILLVDGLPLGYAGTAGRGQVTVTIGPTMPLQDVAARIGDALGVVFKEEVTGKYEEYPAWVGVAGGIEFVLLGPPLPEYDIRDEPSNDYELQIHSLHWSNAPSSSNTDVSLLYAELISKKAGLACAAAERPGLKTSQETPSK
jgi:hypothetical protein